MFKKLFLSVLFIIPMSLFAQVAVKDSIKDQSLLEVVVMGGQHVNKYKDIDSESVAKIKLKDLENPQVYNTITNDVLKEQVVTDMNSALKNATGITRLWESTGRQSDGGEYYTMRGFSLQPTIVNGVASLNNGALDPANVESIDVIKGPSGTLYGGHLIYYGGLINVNTKRPYDILGGEVGYNVGSYGLNRATIDINTPLSPKSALRLNVAYDSHNTFQDAGFSKSIFIAPSFKFKASENLVFYINTEYKSGEAVNAPMYFLYRSSPVTFSSTDLFLKNYKKSYTNDQLTIKTPTFGIQGQALYKISDKWRSQTIVSSSNTKSDGYYQYLWDNANGSDFTRYISKVNSSTNVINIQQNFTNDYIFGKIRNRMVIGADYLQKELRNDGSPWVADGVVSLKDQTDTGVLTTEYVDNLLANGTTSSSNATTKIWSGYISDVFNFTEHFSAMAGLRLDNYTVVGSELKNQLSLSHKFGLVYQPIVDKLSIFSNYTNGFQNLDPVSEYDSKGVLVKTKVLDPEHANQWEVGIKTNLYEDKISLTASYYDIKVSNKTMTDPNNVLNTVQGAQIKSKGIEVSLIANPFLGMNIIAGYSHNSNKVTRDSETSDYLGLRSEDAGPANLFNLWLSYKVERGNLKGLIFGFGANSASKYNTLNRHSTGIFTLPGYTIFNALIGYNSPKGFGVSFKMDNLANKKYFGGWSTVMPQRLRNTTLALSYKF